MPSNCYHWDVTTTGTCEKCGTFVTVQEAIEARVAFGGSGFGAEGEVYGTLTVYGYQPTIRNAIALALGVTDEAIVLEDVRPRDNSWEGYDASYRVAGSKVIMFAAVRFSPVLKRDPERVEYEPVETA